MRRKTLQKESQMFNTAAYNHYFSWLFMLAVSSIEYQNVPDSFDYIFFERCLVERGSGLVFRDEVADELLGLPAMLDGNWNVYNVPVHRIAYATNSYRYECGPQNSVVVYNNPMRMPDVAAIGHYARRLANMCRIEDVNMEAQKTPVLILCSEKERLTLKNLYEQYSGNEPFIFGGDDLLKDSSDFTVLKTDAPFISDKINDIFWAVFNEFLSYFGISNVGNEKKQRMLVDEVTKDMGLIGASRAMRLESRQQGVDRINKMFGTKIKVGFREIEPMEDGQPYNLGSPDRREEPESE